MANFLSPVPGDLPDQGDDHLEAMLSGQPLPESVNAELQGVDAFLATLREARMDRLERRGQAMAQDEYRKAFAGLQTGGQPHRGPAMPRTPLRVKLGAALAAGAVGLGAVGAAALTRNMPLARDKTIATAPGDKSSADQSMAAGAKGADQKVKAAAGTKTAVGPDASGPAAFGLCTAWAHVETKGQVAAKSVAFRNLAAAAGKAGIPGTLAQITAYCVTVTRAHLTKTGKPATHTPAKPSSHPTAKPSSHPTAKPSSHPTAKPSSHPTGKPSIAPGASSGSHPTKP
jgi:hypothetical protein